MKSLQLFWLIMLMISVINAETFIIDETTIKEYSPKIGIALGGGSAKGFYHLGILEALQENNIEISAISGTSMGSIIGGAYALGYDIYEIKQIIEQLDFYNVFTVSSMKKHYPFTYERGWFSILTKEPIGLADSYSIEEIIKQYTFNYDYLKNFDFDEYPVRLRIVATDFPSGEMVVHKKGPLYKAVMSSISIPFILKPFYWQDHYYLDGVLSEVVPLSALQEMELDILIGVDVVGSTIASDAVYQLHSFALQYFDINVRNIGKQSISLADIMISIPHDEQLTRIDFAKHKEFIKKGYLIAYDYLEQINDIIQDYDDQKIIDLVRIDTGEGVDAGEYQGGNRYSFTKIIRDIYIQNQRRSLIVEINKDDQGYFIRIDDHGQAIKKIDLVDPYSVLKKEYNEVLQGYIGLNYNNKTKDRISRAILQKVSDQDRYLINPEYGYNNGELKVTLNMVRIDSVRIDGNHYLPGQFIRDHIQIKEHEIYDKYRVNNSLASLYRTGLFQDIYLSYQKQPGEKGLLLEVEVKEKPQISGWLGLNYFSLQKQAELTLGLDHFTTFLGQDIKTDIEYTSASGYQSGFGLNILFYNAFADLEYSYRKKIRELPVYEIADISEYSVFDYQQDIQQLMVSYQTYDYLEISAGLQNNSIVLEQDISERSVHYHNWYYRFSYNTLDKNWFPDNGLKYQLEIRDNAIINDQQIDATMSDLWLTKEISLNDTLWFQYQGYHTNAADLEYFWYSPHKYLQPNGTIFNEVFSASYNYSRVSYLRKVFLGSRIELNVDTIDYLAVDGQCYQHQGTAVMFHYPSNLGIFTAGYSCNELRNIWQINLAKRF